MRIDLQLKINNDPRLKTFIRQYPNWYKELNRNPSSYNNFVNDMKSKYKITTADKLLDENGNLKHKGYATELLLEYKRNDIKANKWRIKEWDYYLVYNKDYAIALTIADNSYMGLVTASFIDLKNKWEKTIILENREFRIKKN